MRSLPIMTSMIFSMSSFRITAPVGLFGYGKIIALVFGVIAFKRFSLVSLKLSSSKHGTSTATPPERRTHGLYETYEGAGTRTSSPGFTSILIARSIGSEAPIVTSSSSIE